MGNFVNDKITITRRTVILLFVHNYYYLGVGSLVDRKITVTPTAIILLFIHHFDVIDVIFQFK